MPQKYLKTPGVSKVRAKVMPGPGKVPIVPELNTWVGSKTAAGRAGLKMMGFRMSCTAPSGWRSGRKRSGGGGVGRKVTLWKNLDSQRTVSPDWTVTSLGTNSRSCTRPSLISTRLFPAMTRHNLESLGPGSLRPCLPCPLACSSQAFKAVSSCWALALISAWLGTSVAIAGATSTIPRIPNSWCSRQTYWNVPGVSKVTEKVWIGGVPGKTVVFDIMPELTKPVPLYFSTGWSGFRVGKTRMGFIMATPWGPPGTGRGMRGSTSPGGAWELEMTGPADLVPVMKETV